MHFFGGRGGCHSDSGLMGKKEWFNETFPPTTAEEWTKKAEESLKGKSVEKLSRNTYENIKMKPLYSSEDLSDQSLSQFPGYPDYRRGIHPLGYVTNEWKVAQSITASNSEELTAKLTSALQKGQTAISFEVSEHVIKDLPKSLMDIFKTYPFCLNAKEYQSQLLKVIGELAEKQDPKEKVTGYIAADPIAYITETGHSSEKMTTIYDQWVKTIGKAAEKLPNLKTILVDTTPYHNGGANAVQELAIALASSVQHLRMLTERGLSLETVLSKFVFKFSIGANFFMEIAKLRAAKLLWGKITEAYGANTELQKMVISAETSKFTKTKYDPYVNLLRAGNEAFAAVVGGIQYLHVSPFNEPERASTAFSDRIARNTQLILKEEALLKKTIDPAGGSYYIESLTNELAEKAWELFLEIDEQGGMVAALQSNWLQEQILAVKTKRQEDIFTRKQSVIGTNIYATLDDQPLQVDDVLEKIDQSEHKGEIIQPLTQERLAGPFEKLRGKSERLKKATGSEPAVGLICLGELKQHKSRADFISAFLAPGGIQAVKSKEIQFVIAASTFVKKTAYHHYCVCGSNQQYEEFGLELVKELSIQFPNVSLYLAGIPENQSEWTNTGIQQFIHVKSNCYETLSSILHDMEVE